MATKTDTPSDSAFTGLRGIFWPVHGFELKKFLPMGIMMMCILFNYTILRDTKDTLMVNAPGGGAECLSFLKLYGVTPAAILFMIVFIKLANVFSRERLFYAILTPFLVFFGLFAFIIYPNKEALHMSMTSIQAAQASLPNLHWLIPVVGNWSFSIFYILSELWGSVVLSMLFWQFANEITKVTEAKRFYGLFGMILSLYRQNKFPGIGQMFRYTLRDESNHIEVFRNLFMDLVEENREIWTGDFKEELRQTMAEGVQLEKDFIKDCLPVNAVGLRLDDFLSYIDYIADRRLEGCGLAPLNAGIKNPLPWLAEMMDIKKEQNFFEGRVTEYQKASALNVATDDEL